MKIIIAENAGFCYGVMRAISMADEYIEKKGSIYSFGPIIHNPQVVADYEQKGMHVIESIDNVDRPVLIRSHGVPSGIYKKLQSKNIEYIDATCPFVKEAQDYVKHLAEEGYSVVIIGDKDHPEVKAHISYADHNAVVINSVDEARKVDTERIGVVSQTTQSVDRFSKIVGELSIHCKELKVYNTICDATKNRQDAASSLAEVSDVMIVIGGRNSANTRKLYEICKHYCDRTYHIETEKEIDNEWFLNAENVGITAGASTPSYIIERVFNCIKGL